MLQTDITLIIDGNTYILNPKDKAGIARLPSGDRQQLVTLLEAIQQYEQQRRAVARKAEVQANAAASLANTQQEEKQRLGDGDIDQLMAKLALEEKSNRKPGPSRQGLFKWLGITVGVIILLILIF